MKKTLLFALALAVVFVMPSCEKDPKPSDEPSIEPTEEMIVFGNYTNMDVATYDHVDWEYQDNDVIYYYFKDFDVNGDGNYDFEICSSISISPFQDNEKHYQINLRSSRLEFHSELVSTELYRHPDSTIILTDSIPLIYIDEIISCNKTLESDTFVETYSRRGVKNHSKNDLLNMNDSIFVPTMGGGFMYESSVHFPYYIDLEETDATVYKSTLDAREDCFNFPLDEEIYVGFKYIEERRTRLGWIKIIIESNANGDLIARPLESAIQQ